MGIGIGDVFCDRSMKEVDILADEGYVFPDLPQFELFQIDSIEGDPSLDRVVKAAAAF